MAGIFESITGTVKPETDKPTVEEPKVDVVETVTDEPKDLPKTFKITYNKKEIELPESERDTYAQKGYHLPVVQGRLDIANKALTKAAHIAGFENVSEYIADLDKKEIEVVRQKISDAYDDPDKIDEAIKQHPAVKESMQMKEQIRKQELMQSISGKKYFNELKPEIDGILSENPNIDADIAYKFLLGEYIESGKLDELVSQTKEKTEKKVMADIHDQARRGKPKESGASDGSEVILTNTQKKIAEAMGLDEKEYAKRLNKKK